MTKLPVATYPIDLDGRTIAAIVISADVEIQVSVVRPPVAEGITSVAFTRGDPDMSLRGTPQLQAVDPGLNLTSRPVEVVVTPAGGAPNAPITLDMIDPNASFDCNEGDGYSVRGIGSVNAAGTGPPGSPFTGTATTGTSGNLPPPEVVTGVNFTPA
jgi:hypothetical protein